MKVTAINKMGCAAAHNDRDFTIDKDSHIDISRVHLNVYGNIYNDPSLKFKDLEKRYYKENYTEKLDALNKAAIKNNHYKRVQTMTNYMQKHGPEELLLQIGGMNDNIDPEQFKACVMEFLEKMEKYNSNCHILDWAIHLDEKTPHAHIRKVWDYTNEDGIKEVSKNKALKEMGIGIPNESEPEYRFNNRSVTFDRQIRELWTGIAEEHGFTIQKTTERQFNSSRQDMAISKYKEEMVKEDMELARERFDNLKALETEYEEKRIELERKTKELEKRDRERQMEEDRISKQMASMQQQINILQAALEEYTQNVEDRKRELQKLKEAKEKEMAEISKMSRKNQKNIEKETGVKVRKERDKELVEQ